MNKILLGLVLGLGFYGISYAETEVAAEETVETAVAPEETAAMPEIGVQANLNQDEKSITLEIMLPIFDVESMEVVVVGDDQSPTKFLVGYDKVQEDAQETTKAVAETDAVALEEVVTEETKTTDEQEAEKPEGFILVLPDDIDPESMRVEREESLLRVTFDLAIQEQSEDEIKEIVPSEEEIEIVVEEDEEDDEEEEA